MEYLVEVQWDDPTASSVAHILSTLPAELETATGVWPTGAARAFCVLRAKDRQSVDRVIDAISESGAAARVISGARDESTR